MQKKYVFGLSALIVLALSTVIFVACQKGEVHEINDVLNLSSTEKVEVERLFPLTGEMGIYPSSENMNTFMNLNEEQLNYFIELQAKERATLDGHFQPEDGLSYEDMVMLFRAQVSAVDDLSVMLLNKHYNKLSEEEIGDLLVNYALDIVRVMKKEISSDAALKFLDQYEKEIENEKLGIVSFSEVALSSRSSCSKYFYGIKTYIADSGDRSCDGYEEATNLVDDDCDYEFIFEWPHNYTPSYQLGLHSTGWSTSRILNLGGINGRMNVNDGTVRFLIGQKRIYACLTTPNGVKKHLKGNW